MAKISQKRVKELQDKENKAEERKQTFLAYSNKLEREGINIKNSLHLYSEDFPESIEAYVKMLISKKVAERIIQVARDISAIACDIPLE